MVDPTKDENKPKQQAAKLSHKIDKNPRQHSQSDKATDNKKLLRRRD